VTKLYIIGDKDGSVVFIRLDPLRASLMTAADIKEFAKHNNYSPGEVIKDCLDNAQYWVEDAQNSTAVDKVRFCYVADMTDEQWLTERNPFPPVKAGLEHVGDPSATSDVAPVSTELSYRQEPDFLKKKRSAKNAKTTAVRRKKTIKKNDRRKPS